MEQKQAAKEALMMKMRLNIFNIKIFMMVVVNLASFVQIHLQYTVRPKINLQPEVLHSYTILSFFFKFRTYRHVIFIKNLIEKQKRKQFGIWKMGSQKQETKQLQARRYQRDKQANG